MSRLEAVANVALRLPGLALLELLHRGDPALPPALLGPARGLGHVLSVVVLVLPVRSLVTLYLRLLAALLLAAGHLAARDYIRRELELGFQDAVSSDAAALGRLATTLAGQLCLCALCSLLVRGRWPWLLVAPLLPLVARLCGVPPPALPAIATFAAGLSVLGGLCVLSPHLLVPVRLAATACREVTQALELSRLVALGVSLWSQLNVPLLFLAFWLVLFSLRLSAFLTGPPGSPLAQHGLLFLLLSSVAECCGTPYSLLGLAFTVSYLALGVLNLCKFYLLGFGGLRDGNATHRGVTEGVTLLLLALQTGLLDLQILQRTFLLSIILFIVLTSTMQSMVEIAHPVVLALAASRNRSPWKHFRGVSLCLFLLVFPSFLAYEVAGFFHLDFWLLILLSSCVLTSLQVLGTLSVYALLAAAPAREERLEELVSGVSALSRALEFLVALCVVAFGARESLVGEWSWVGASVLVVHSYFNVWLRARSGWRSLLLRRRAARKIRCLPRATRRHDDVCAVCFQDMQVAVVTPCGHFFHAACLRKWLCVQDTCPMCHQQVTPVATEEDAGIRTVPDHGDKDGGATASPVPDHGDEDRGATANPVPDHGDRDRGATASPAPDHGDEDGGATASPAPDHGDEDRGATMSPALDHGDEDRGATMSPAPDHGDEDRGATMSPALDHGDEDRGATTSPAPDHGDRDRGATASPAPDHKDGGATMSPAPDHGDEDRRTTTSPAPDHGDEDRGATMSLAPDHGDKDRGTTASPAPDHGDEDRGATASPVPAQPLEDGDSVVPGQGDSGAAQDDGAGDPRPPHPAQPHASAPQEPEAGAVPQPPRDPHPRVGDTQRPDPSPASLEATTGDSGDPHSSRHPS